MEIVFAGIICWVNAKSPKSGKTVIIPNSTAGGSHGGADIPGHNAFIHAKHHQVDSSNWKPDITAGEDNVIYLLKGDFLTFDPVPSGGSIKIDDLPHVKLHVADIPICSFADELRPAYRDEPNAANVAALVELPADAQVSTSSNGRGAMFAKLHIANGPVTLTATSFDGTNKRSLTIADPSASLFICNVTMGDYLLGNPAKDDNHRYLICEMFRPRATHSGTTTATEPPDATVRLSDLEESIQPPDLSGLVGASGMAMHDYLVTFAAGCSDSQWP